MCKAFTFDLNFFDSVKFCTRKINYNFFILYIKYLYLLDILLFEGKIIFLIVKQLSEHKSIYSTKRVGLHFSSTQVCIILFYEKNVKIETYFEEEKYRSIIFPVKMIDFHSYRPLWYHEKKN